MLKKYKVKVNGNEYNVEVEEIVENIEQTNTVSKSVKAEIPTKKQAPKKNKEGKQKVVEGSTAISSPMPGTILRVDVEAGEKVSKGQVLLILEAMKMENEITAPQDGTVASINVKKGDSVNAGDVLVSIS